MKKFLSVLLIVVLVFSLVACQPSDKKEKKDDKKESKEKILVVSKEADLNSMDPQVATDGLSFEAIAAVTDGLYTLDKDGNAVPAMAEKTEVSKDGKVYTFKLRDAKWSNGTKVTAHDFVFAFRRLGSKELASSYNYMLEVAAIKNYGPVLKGDVKPEELGVKAVDDKTFEVTLERPISYFDKLMAFPSFYPANEEFVKKAGEQYGLTPETTLYNGPFVWTKWISGNSFSLMKNKTYWDKDAVKLDGITFKVALEAQSAVLDYENGGTHYVYLKGDLVDKYKDKKGYKISLGSYLWWLQVNQYSKKWNNPNFQKAVALSFDRDKIAKFVLKDGAIPAYFFVPKKLASDAQGKDFRETSGNYYTEGKEKGKEYWEKAKKEMKVEKLEFEILYEDSDASKKVAEFLKSEIEANLKGMTVKLRGVPKKTRLQIMRGKEDDYDFGLTRWGPDYADPMTYLELYASNAAGNPGRGGFLNKKYDELIKLANSGTQKAEDRWKTLVEAEKLLLESGLGPITIYQTGAAHLMNPKVKNVYNQSVGIPFIYKWGEIED